MLICAPFIPINSKPLIDLWNEQFEIYILETRDEDGTPYFHQKNTHIPDYHPGQTLFQVIPLLVAADTDWITEGCLCKEELPCPDSSNLKSETLVNDRKPKGEKTTIHKTLLLKCNTLDPTPSEAQYQHKASNAAGLFLTWKRNELFSLTRDYRRQETSFDQYQ